jgi:hypothetical protein
MQCGVYWHSKSYPGVMVSRDCRCRGRADLPWVAILWYALRFTDTDHRGPSPAAAPGSSAERPLYTVKGGATCCGEFG